MSGALPYFGDAYMADTRHLSLEEHGAYHLLILIAWRSPNCCLPDDDRRIAQMLGVTARKWATLKPVVMSFWGLGKNGWEQKRLTKERRWVEEKSRKNKKSAEGRWNAKPLENNDTGDANAHANAHPNVDANGYAPLPPPKKKSSVDKSTDGKPSENEPVDRVKELFEMGISILGSAGYSEKQVRSLIGKWRKGGERDAEVLVALLECRTKLISEPVEWLTKRLKPPLYVSATGYEYKGDIDAIIRESEKRADWGTHWSARADKKKLEQGARR